MARFRSTPEAFARPYFHYRKIVAHAGGVSYTPPQLRKLYAFPPDLDGSVHAIQRAAQDKVSAISISWGAPEDQWSQNAIQGMEGALKAAADAGITVTAAAGDNGSSDGEIGDHVDVPGSMPYITCCGGT